MSRETDTSSSGPQGRGGAAYPSGTPPYGIPAQGAAPEDGADAAARPEERKTETTLTTRIRINIPGSRPIPPVVMRTPVSDADASAAKGPAGRTEGTDGAGGPRSDAGASGPGAAASGSSAPSGTGSSPAAAPSASAEEKTSDWFAPRKPAAGRGGAPAGGGTAGGSSANSPTTPGGSGPQGSGAGVGTGLGTGAGATGGPGRGPGAAGAGTSGTGAGLGAGPGGPGPFGSRPPARGASGPAGPGGPGGPGAPGSPRVSGSGAGTGGTSPFDSYDTSAPDGGASQAFKALGEHGSLGPDPQSSGLPYFSESGNGRGPAGPTGGTATGEGPLLVPPGDPAPSASPRMSDDTAILTPQRPAPVPGPGGPAGPGGPGAGAPGIPGDNISGHTVTSGIPVVPPSPNSPFAPGGHTDGPVPHSTPRLPEPSRSTVQAATPPKKKGRSKLVLAAVGVVFAGGVAYGAGLLMNHSDVPKGTTVLGVDIGGGTRDEAVQKLDSALDDRTTKALQLSVDGKTVALKPDQAGLRLDSQSTVSAAAGSDYNPVSVIGSLFGGERVVDPVMPVDGEKLQAALELVAGESGSVTEGTIKFQSGKAVAVYGKAGKGIDPAKAATAIEEAYRTQVETGRTAPVQVPTTTRRPTVTNAEVDRMMKAFAKPAMSGLVTVQTDAAHLVSFSPERSIYKFLSVRAVDGKLVEHYDLKVLESLYGSAFDGVTITKGDGSKKPVSPQDVASALGQALRGKTAAERVVTIPTNPR
ncbi:hypothetical protein ABT009_18640 [Streptomyces sp. NPDC002896]|uniref:hypothetical protein n=1 Tax=Streptomyces sp. NPDC002896 TaxID=3154438 RepID=UPI003321C13D